MAAIAVVGFERGTHLGIAIGNATNRYMDRTQGTLGTNIEVVSAAARTGGYGLRITQSAAQVFCGWANNANTGMLGTSAVIVVSFWVRIPSFPGANAIIFQAFGTTGGADMSLTYVSGSNAVQASVGGTTVTGPTLVANTWTHVDVRCDFTTTTHALDWRINEVSQTQVTAAGTAEQIFIAGFSIENTAQTITYHVDDVVMSITSGDYPFGKHKVVQLLPEATVALISGAAADSMARFTANGTLDATFNAAQILAAISEVPPTISASADGVYQRTTGNTNAIEIPFGTYTLAGGETVTGLRIVVTGWAATATANNVSLRTFNGTTETSLFTASDPNFDNSTTAPASLCKMATLANFDTQAELDALMIRFGYSTDISPQPGAHAIYAELGVKEAAGKAPPPRSQTRRRQHLLVR